MFLNTVSFCFTMTADHCKHLAAKLLLQTASLLLTTVFGTLSPFCNTMFAKQKQQWKLTQNWLLLCPVIFLIRGTRSNLAAIFSGGRRHPRPVDWAGERVSFSLFREGLDILLLQIFFFFFSSLSWIQTNSKQFKQLFSIRNTCKNV